jgi:hypothetical protein
MTGIMAGGARSGQPASASSSPIPEDAPVMRMDFERKKSPTSQAFDLPRYFSRSLNRSWQPS